MDIKSLHHVAYRCKDAKQTAEFYTEVLGLEYAMAMAEDRVPSTGEQSPCSTSRCAFRT
jgi:glyoxylase I family protein